MEGNEANNLCDYVIDSTKTPKEVLQEVLEIINNN
jgi:hypothetical protein